jgi:predicted nicotinamide N-methyase
MQYPIKLTVVMDGFLLYVPISELVRPTYEDLRTGDKTVSFPFWAKIWASSRAMTLFLEAEPTWIQSKRVLELGAGIGLPTFKLAQHALEMTISDHDAEAVELLEKNIEYFGLKHAKARCLDWNNFPEDITADTLLLSDINYDPSQFKPLLNLILKFIDSGSTVIIATPERITASPFAMELEPFIHRSFLQSVVDMNQQIDIRMMILSL